MRQQQQQSNQMYQQQQPRPQSAWKQQQQQMQPQQPSWKQFTGGYGGGGFGGGFASYNTGIPQFTQVNTGGYAVPNNTMMSTGTAPKFELAKTTKVVLATPDGEVKLEVDDKKTQKDLDVKPKSEQTTNTNVNSDKGTPADPVSTNKKTDSEDKKTATAIAPTVEPTGSSNKDAKESKDADAESKDTKDTKDAKDSESKDAGASSTSDEPTKYVPPSRRGKSVGTASTPPPSDPKSTAVSTETAKETSPESTDASTTDKSEDTKSSAVSGKPSKREDVRPKPLVTNSKAAKLGSPKSAGNLGMVKSFSMDNINGKVQAQLGSGKTVEYKDGQFSPLNPQGKKQYDKDFLLKFKDENMEKPFDLDLSVIKVNNDDRKHKRNNNSHGGKHNKYDNNYSNSNSRKNNGRYNNDHGHGGGRRHKGRKGKNRRQERDLPPVEPLKKGENGWVPHSKTGGSDEESPLEVLLRKTRGLLNKLTWEKFETLYEQIMDLGIDSAEIMEGMISEIFDKALDEPTWGPLYAELCARMKEEVSSFDDPNSEKPITFKRLLLDKCQKSFETRENVEDVEGYDEMNDEDKELARVKIKRKMLGNIRFIGELFKLGMLTANIMHECLRQLLTYEDVPEEADLECLAKLLTTIGKTLDTEDNAKNMSAYFARINTITKDKRLPARVRFMLIDVVDLRKDKWVPRRNDNAPKTIAEVHKEAAEAKRKELQELNKNSKGGGRKYGKKGRNNRNGGRDNDNWKGKGKNRGSRNNNDRGNNDRGNNGNSSSSRNNNRNNKRGSSSSNPNKSSSLDNLASEASSEDTGPSEQERIETVERKSMSLLREFLQIRDIKEAMLCIDDLNAPELLHKALETMINYAFEAKTKEIEPVGDLVEAMAEREDMPKAVFKKAFDNILENLQETMMDAPNAWKTLAQLLGRALVAKGLPSDYIVEALTELNDLVEKGIVIKIVCEAFVTIEDQKSQPHVCEVIREAELKDLEMFMPLMERNTGELDTILKEYGLQYVSEAYDESMMISEAEEEEETEVNCGEQILAKLEKGESASDILQWIQANVEEERRTTADFAQLITATMSDFLAISCLPKGVFAAIKEPKEEMKTKEKELMQEYQTLLKRFLGDGDTVAMQVAGLYGVQEVANKRSFPKGWVGRMFHNLYELELIYDPEAFNTWKESEDETGGKQSTIKEAAAFFEFLKE
eukprot:TRINITY_DN7391_c1_g1_i2.p1 TRINITY_DN7391_c1_g1~~TRINITY_DN7391_c1_g1_i2.p1  ORF type:complete len:1194 (-),score=542.44 TRINITY_DN7391_c1_g1_i2:54-3635(-)